MLTARSRLYHFRGQIYTKLPSIIKTRLHIVYEASWIQRNTPLICKHHDMTHLQSCQSYRLSHFYIVIAFPFIYIIWPHLTSIELIWPHLTSLDLIWLQLISFHVVWWYLTFDLTWPHWISLDLWPHMTSFDLIWCDLICDI